MADNPDRMPRPDRERLPFEDLEKSLYLHNREGLFTVSTGPHDDETTYYLPVQRFMEVQRERDDWRRVAGLANALLRQAPYQKTDEEIVREVRELFDKSTLAEELTQQAGEAMLSIVQSVREGL